MIPQKTVGSIEKKPYFNFSASEFAVLPTIYKRAVAECDRVNGFVPYEHGFVYAIQAVGTNYIKFGKSKNPDRRLLQISPKMPFGTRFIKVWRSNFMSLAEKSLHERLQEFRTSGEWFDVPKALQYQMFIDDSHDCDTNIRYAYGQFFLDEITLTDEEELKFWEWVTSATDGIIYGLSSCQTSPCSELFIALIENLFFELTCRDFQIPEDFSKGLWEGVTHDDFMV